MTSDPQKTFLGTTLLLVLCTLIPALAEEKPNIILVMADDQGWGDAAYNDHPWVKTDTMDTMAAEGFSFDRFYASSPVCSPTRASVLTGRHAFRTNVTNYGRYLDPREQTLAETLKQAGYVTGLFGKLHIGSGQPNTACNPSGMGFDDWVIGLNFFDNDPYLSRNGTVEHREGKGSVLLVDDAIEFLHKHRDGEKPLFMLVWFPSPHHPHEEVPDGPSLYEDKPDAGYFREITLLDQQLGRLRQELRTSEIADNTIFWYCSDNGGLVDESAGGRAKKGSIYEGGLRVPSLVEWPARKLSGQSSIPATTSDLYPTLLAMAGIELDAPHPLDGIDLSGAFEGTLVQRPEPIGFWHGVEDGILCYSDKFLKAIMEKQQSNAPLPHDAKRLRLDVDERKRYPDDFTPGHAAWNDWPWKLHRIDGDTYELYHLEDDPMETTDLAAKPEQRKRVETMRTALDQWTRSVIASMHGDDYPEN